ncbi:adenosylcobinamide amidohydrolase [Vulcanisaeta thermophila]|uniref:adenosylcobinamide amidohydrolase n=1 Tax=Vulcanisaeta thermophila TaxID=867917 RepID=UPI00085399D3|nr:adenosylcobinamide amidohydrolase [Vulcanisaeta thermophila]
MRARFTGNNVIIELDGEYTALSSTVDGGLRNGIRHVIHHQVPTDFNQDPINEVERACNELGIDHNHAITFLTATELPRNHTLYTLPDNSVAVSITMGLTNTYNINETPRNQRSTYAPSTINIAVIINKPLTQTALVDALRITSEVKAVTLGSRLGIHGTVSDAIAVIAPSGDDNKYAGPATAIGKAIINAVSDAINNALSKYLGH